MDNFLFRQGTLLLCLIGIVGSCAVFTNAVYNNGNATIAAAVGSGMFVLFLAIVAELAARNVKIAIHDQKVAENDELLAVVISKAVFRAMAEEKEKQK